MIRFIECFTTTFLHTHSLLNWVVYEGMEMIRYCTIIWVLDHVYCIHRLFIIGNELGWVDDGITRSRTV